MDSTEVCPSAERLKALLDRELPENEQTALNTHLEDCPRCQQTLEGLVAGKESWADLARHLQGAAGAETTRTALPNGAGSTGPASTSPAAAPQRLGRFEIREEVGRGGMGVVYKAFDPQLHRIVALKVMAPELATSAAARQRFDREVKAAAGIAHEHVVTIHSVEPLDGLPGIVMQYVAGVSLQERIERSGPLQLKEILRIGMQAARGLAAAHAQGMVHRDVKPANILLENGIERVRITDFGLARAVDDASLTQSGVIAGTPMYMAPEQAAGQAIDHRADLFSLGSVLYAMCTGRPPFRASGTMAVLKRVCEETPRPIREINPDIPDWLCAIIEKLHAKKPEERFQSAREVGDLLEAHLAHLQQPSRVPLPPPVERPSPAPPVRRRRLRRWAARLGIAALVGWALFWFGPAALRFLDNRGDVAFSADGPGLVRVMVFRNGQKVTDFDPGTNPTIELPPAKYLLIPVQVPGRAVNYWEMTAFDMFSGDNYRLPGITCEFNLKRGQRVSVRALMHDSVAQANAPTDKERIQGRWVAESGESYGQPLSADEIEATAVVFTGGNVRLTMPGIENGEATFKLDPTVSPKEIDIIRVGDSAGMLGIYRLDRDRLTICMGDSGDARPARLDATRDPTSKRKVIVFRRPSDAEQGWVQLFNGKDLTGWKRDPDQPGDWRVENGVLIGRGPAANELVSARPDFESFHLRLEAKINASGNSGLIFRRAPAGERPGKGYESDIDPSWMGALTKRLGTGTPVPLGKPVLGGIAPDKWFSMEVIADGNSLTTIVDGNTVAKFRDDGPDSFRRGSVALQVYNPGTIVQFRKIEIKELPPSSPDVPRTAADVLPSLVGTWKIERQSPDPKSPPDEPPFVGYLTYDFVAGGKFLRGRSSVLASADNFLDVFAFDPGNNVVRRWVARSDGWTGPVSGQFNPANRTLVMSLRIGDLDSIHQYEFLDANAYFHQFFLKNASGTIIREVRHKGTRVSGPVTLPNVPLDPKRPEEMKVLDRLVGEWRSEITVTDSTTPDKPKTQTQRTKAESVLGGRFVELIETDEATGGSDYALVWYDASAKKYRQWSFHGAGYSVEMTGTWDEATKTLAWNSPDNRLERRWILKGDDLREFRHLAKATDGKVLNEAVGVSRRVASGFVSLFNGKDLTGWKRSPEQPGNWRVVDGVLIGDGGFSRLLTERGDYENFHLRLEVKYAANSNGGLLLRAPFALGSDVKSKRDVGDCYEVRISPGNGTSCPPGFLRRRGPRIEECSAPLNTGGVIGPDTWFTLEVIAKGNYIVVMKNGEIEVNYTDASSAVSKGHLALMVDMHEMVEGDRQEYTSSTPIYVRRIEIKELPKSDPGGFVSLFNGKDLAGWKEHPDQPGDWKVENGVLVGRGRKSHLFSERGDYANFHLRFEAKYNAVGDSGVIIRTPYYIKPGWGGPLGYEAQITKTRTGTVLVGEEVFGDPFVAAPDEWFTGEVIATNNRIVVRVNGVTTANFEDPKRTYMNGHLALQVWNPETVVHFRKIEIHELPRGKDDAPPLAVGPFDAAKAKEHQEAWAKHLGVSVEETNSLGMKLRLIPPGRFAMGSPDDDPGRDANEGPRHDVSVPEPFYMGAHHVTVGQFRAFVTAKSYKTDAENSPRGGSGLRDGQWVSDRGTNWQNPGYGQSDDYPVTCVSWNDARAFCDWLSEKEGRRYALPTEAQWEYACRAGSAAKYHFGGDDARLDEYAWYTANSDARAHAVGKKKSNAWGLYDMHGGAWQWTADRYAADAYRANPGDDPPRPNTDRVARGGSWFDAAERTRSAHRGHFPQSWTETHVGFRVVLLDPKPPAGEQGFVPLFNGKELTGWKTHPKQPGNWRVEGGELVGSGPTSHLFSERADFGDFHLRVEAKLNDSGNSGVCFRSLFDLLAANEGNPAPPGYEAEINNVAKQAAKTGSLWRIGPRLSVQAFKEALVPPDTWFTLEVIAVGGHITVKVNGQTTVDWEDEQLDYRKGHIALQVNWPATTVVRFRKIQIKELSEVAPAPREKPRE